MASDRDDRWGEDEWAERRERDPERDAEVRRRAAAKVATPATLMIVSGVIMLLLLVANIGVVASGYDVQVKMLEWIEGMQPPGPQKQQMQQEVEKAKNRDRSAEYVQTVIFGVIGLAMDVLVLIGGIKMKQLRGYTLAMIGSICAIVPLNSCCCVGIPVGIWSLVVLLNADVKAAFQSASLAGGRGEFPEER